LLVQVDLERLDPAAVLTNRLPGIGRLTASSMRYNSAIRRSTSPAIGDWLD
jgi:hypothetical protein